MDNRSNTIGGWVLAGCVAALGLSIVSGMMFHHEPLVKFGYPIEGGDEGAAGGGGDAPIAARLATADAAKGAESFKKCTACHSIDQGGANGVGPNLYGTVGEAIATGKGGFAFSDALKKVGGEWDFEKLDAWLKSPRKFADGTKMTFAGLGDAQERANVILYLNQQGSNLPLPAAPAAGEEAAPAGNTADAAVANTADAETGNVANTATPAPGAPTVDKTAAERAPK